MGFCNDIPPTCDVCFEVLYGKCNDVLTLSLGLNPSTTYYLNLTDKFDIVTPLTVTTDIAGDFEITQTWTEFFGAVEMEVYSDAAQTMLVTVVQNSVVYNCILLVQFLSGSNNIIPPSSFDTDALAYFSASGITDVREMNAANTFIVGAKTAGIWIKLTTLYMISPTSLAAAAVNAKTPGTFDISWANTPTHSDTGVDFNGTNEFGRTGFIVPNANAHISYYSRDDVNSAAQFDMGCRDVSSSSVTELLSRNGSGNLQGSINHTGSIYGAVADSLGMSLVNKTGAGSTKGWKNAVEVGNISTGAVYNPTFDVWVGCFNNKGVAQSFSTREVAFITMGLELTDADILNLYNLVQIYQQNVIPGGRNV